MDWKILEHCAECHRWTGVLLLNCIRDFTVVLTTRPFRGYFSDRENYSLNCFQNYSQIVVKIYRKIEFYSGRKNSDSKNPWRACIIGSLWCMLTLCLREFFIPLYILFSRFIPLPSFSHNNQPTTRKINSRISVRCNIFPPSTLASKLEWILFSIFRKQNVLFQRVFLFNSRPAKMFLPIISMRKIAHGVTNFSVHPIPTIALFSWYTIVFVPFQFGGPSTTSPFPLVSGYR